MLTKMRERPEEAPPRDKALGAGEANFSTFAETIEALLRTADRDLYRVKDRSGKTVRTAETGKYASIR